MPPRGNQNINIPTKLYEMAKEFYKKYEVDLKRKNIRSVAALFQNGFLDYLNRLEAEFKIKIEYKP